jgi:sensor histidine kinase YesM
MSSAADSHESAAAAASPSPVRTAWLIVILWLGQFGFLTAQRQLMTEGMESLSFLPPRAIMMLVGIGNSFVINSVQRRLAYRPWGRRLLVALVCALAASVVHSVLNFITFQIFMGQENWESASWGSYFMATAQWAWVYAAMSALLLSAVYSDELRERERRLAELQGLAHAAQMRSLRYQLNPHFIFNTLNSIAELIAAGRARQAEQMVENLSDFLRAGLALDPNADLALERELALQSLYLEIEQVRFPDRLRVETKLPPELSKALVPGLILQPLVENAIKHGVARNHAATQVSIAAEGEGGRLVLTVSNDIQNGGPVPRAGTSVGLANVERRLRLRFGDGAVFHAGREADRFVVRLVLPLELEGG